MAPNPITKPFDGNPASVGNGVMIALMVDSTDKVDALYAKALAERRNPDITIMAKLARGQSPETGDWEYILRGNGARRGTGDSGLGAFFRDCHLYVAAHDYNFINSAFYQRNK